MSRLKAQRKLQQAGQSGNWRFKGLMLAALDSEVSKEDVAKAWPDPGKSSDYRFLSGHKDRTPESEANRRVVAEKGEPRHRILSDYVADADNVPKHLSSDPTKELGDGTLGVHLDEAVPRMLFAASDSEEIDTLFREQLLETVMEGAERKKFARDAANVINVDTRKGDVPVAQDEEYADKVGQGAEIRDDREQYATIAWDCEKYGQGARVTDEMRDQAMVDLIERQIQFVGAAVENSVNRHFLTHLVDNANGNYDAGANSATGFEALNEAVGVVDEEDFRPDTYVTHPQFRTALSSDPNLAYAQRAGTNEVVTDRDQSGLFGDILSLETHAAASSSTYDSANGSNTWGYGADELGAAVFDSEHAHLILYSPNGQDMEIKDYDDPIRDLNGVNARLHVDADYSQERSAATIQG